MEEYVYIEGKKYRRGYTTGSCSAAAAKAAATMLLLHKVVDYIQIDTPKGINLTLEVLEAKLDLAAGYAQCAIRKDGGDDIDATHGMLIYARARWQEEQFVEGGKVSIESNEEVSIGSNRKASNESNKRDSDKEIAAKADGEENVRESFEKVKGEVLQEISQDELLETQRNEQIKILGGKGIGVITQKGLSLEVGEPAINSTPRKMIRHAVGKVVGEKPIEITIFAPEGEEIAKKTFNPKLGIVGGISIIGTTGVVEPMSDEGWKRSLSIELEMKRTQGLETILLVPGNQGEHFAYEVLGVKDQYVTRMSNFLGYMLMECLRLGYKKVVLAGPLGKFIKLAAGIFHTHSRVADARSEILIANLALMGAPLEMLQEINECVTTEAALKVIEREGMEEVYNLIADKCKLRAEEHLRAEGMEVEVILFSMAGEELARTAQASEFVEEMK